MNRFFLAFFAIFLPFFSFALPWVNIQPLGIGQTTYINASGFNEFEPLNVDVIQPKGTVISFTTSADDVGLLSEEIYGLHLEEAGKYKVNLFRASGETIKKDLFLPAGSISAYKSQLSVANPQAIANGKNTISVKISLKDNFANPSPYTNVKIYSNNPSDVISAPETTNQNGEIIAKISSFTAGVSVIWAESEGVKLHQKEEIVFTPANGAKNTGNSNFGGLGQFLQAQLFGDGLANPKISYFRVEGLESELVEGEAVNVLVSARDTNGEIVPEYKGTVRFSSKDPQANLPQDYTFTESDQGSHTFFLGVSFNNAGNQNLSVNDLDDFRIFGQWEGNVLPSGGGSNASSSSTSGEVAQPFIKLITPIDGTYKSNRMTITGQSNNVDSVKIRDGSNTLTDGLTADENGGFVYQTPRLADGLHQFQAISEQDGTVTSNIVQVRIDRTPPAAMSVEVQPQNPLKPGQEFQIYLGSSEPLSAGKCVFREIPTNHTKDGEEWVGNYIAPLQTGEYPVSCSVFDVSSNELTEPNAAIIVVVEDEGTTEPVNPPTTGQPASGERTEIEILPTDDSDGDGIRNDEEWRDDNNNNIPDVIENPPEPKDTDKDGLTDDEERTRWRTNPIDADSDDDGIPDGVEIIFTKTNPNQSADPTEKPDAQQLLFWKDLLAVPSPLNTEKANDTDLDGVPNFLEAGVDKVNPRNDSDGDGLENIEDAEPLRPVGEVTVVVPRPTDENCTQTVTNLKTMPYEGDNSKIWLTWNAPTDQNIAYYKIDYGTDRRVLPMQNKTPNARTKWYVENLTPNQEYVFNLTPVLQSGNTCAIATINGTAGGKITATQPTLPDKIPTSGETTQNPIKNMGIAWILGVLTGLLLYGWAKQKKEIQQRY